MTSTTTTTQIPTVKVILIGDSAEERSEAPTQKVKRDFVPSGKLMEDAAEVIHGRKLAWSEPPDATMPVDGWRMYVFKGSEKIGDPILLQNQTSFLLGRDRAIADIPLDHPSCSSQHAVIQFRLHEKQARPYLMDLGSTNGTLLNGSTMKPKVYVELKSKDIVRFAQSTREYVFLHE